MQNRVESSKKVVNLFFLAPAANQQQNHQHLFICLFLLSR